MTSEPIIPLDNPNFPVDRRVICEHDPYTCTLCQWDETRPNRIARACAYHDSIGDVGTVTAKSRVIPAALAANSRFMRHPERRTVPVRFDGTDRISYMGPEELRLLEPGEYGTEGS